LRNKVRGRKLNKASWVECDSEYDMQKILSDTEGCIFDVVEQDYANEWGYMLVDDTSIHIPIGFSSVGLLPEVDVCNTIAYLGISDEVIGYDVVTRKVKFRYKMPSIFHNFIKATDEGVLVQDETGFLYLSSEGNVLWIELCGDIIDSYEVNEDIISGETEDGEEFKFVIKLK